MTGDSTDPSYWLNWRFLLCAIWVIIAIIIASLLIWRYEGRNKSRNKRNGDEEQEAEGCLYKDEAWETCSKSVHPIWLLVYRIIAFIALFVLLIADIVVRGGGIFYFYTQWTFSLVTIYFGLGSILSVHGYLRYFCGVEPKRDYNVCIDTENGSYAPPTLGENENTAIMNERLDHLDEAKYKPAASVSGYTLQIIFQICAGSVVLTDSVFWLIIYPFLTPKHYRLSFLVVCMHSVNAILLLGDAALNSLRFPFFRIAYFALWTCLFVIFQWIIHACVSIRWPYPFLDLSSPYAPLWYLAVGLLIFPCFGIFSLIFRIKRYYLSR